MAITGGRGRAMDALTGGPGRAIGLTGRRIRALAAAALFLLIVADVAAQDRYVQILRQYDRPRAVHEAVVMPGPDSSQAIVAFRIPNSLLVFVREDDRFTANPEVTVTLHRDGSKIDERIWRSVQTASSFEATQDRLKDIVGSVEFVLPPGRYTYELSLSDDVAGAVGKARGGPFVVPDFRSAVLGAPFFGRLGMKAGTMVRMELANLGGDVPFGRRVPIIVPALSFEPTDRLAYRLFRTERAGRQDGGARDDGSAPDGRDELVAEGLPDSSLAISVGDVDASCGCWNANDDSRGRLISLDIGSEDLENGIYRLEVELTRDGERFVTRRTFETMWRDMPMSLYDVEVAIRHLGFIESRERVRALLRGSRDDRIERFRAYWKERDPTPATVYNELMAEYYGRIDAAARRFQTGKTPYPDGLRTDAARIYVVHGRPDDVANSFPSSGGVEQVWTYPDGRKFVFWAASSLDALQLRDEPSSRTADE